MAERTLPSANSLVKYDNPVLVTKHAEKKTVKGSSVRPCSPTKGAASEAKRETEEILNAILPPKEWEEDGNRWTQQVWEKFGLNEFTRCKLFLKMKIF